MLLCRRGTNFLIRHQRGKDPRATRPFVKAVQNAFIPQREKGIVDNLLSYS